MIYTNDTKVLIQINTKQKHKNINILLSVAVIFPFTVNQIQLFDTTKIKVPYKLLYRF